MTNLQAMLTERDVIVVTIAGVLLVAAALLTIIFRALPKPLQAAAASMLIVITWSLLLSETLS